MKFPLLTLALIAVSITSMAQTENFSINDFKWTRQPQSYEIKNDTVEIVTKPHTDLWQRTYYRQGEVWHLCLLARGLFFQSRLH